MNQFSKKCKLCNSRSEFNYSDVLFDWAERSDIDFFIKCGFSLENVQPSPAGYDTPIKNSRYWSAGTYKTKSFNDFIYFNLRESILKRVIDNGLTGSS